MKTWVIYKHTLKDGFDHSGWSYIGLTCQSLKKRWQNGANYKNSLIFYKAIKKYGWDNFSHEVIETDIDTLEKANEREKYWILFYHTCILDEACKGYNITWGGDGTSGHKVSIELRQKISEIKKGTHLSEVTKQKISKSMIGHKISDENLKKLTIAKLGKPRPDYVKVKISQATTNKHTKQVFCIELAKVFNSVKEAASFCGVSQCHLSNALTGRKQSAGGYHWIWFKK